MLLIDPHRRIITQSALFQNLPKNGCLALLDAGRCHQAATHSFLFHAGEPASTFYLVISGKVRLVQATPSGRQVILHYISAGRYLGVSVALSQMQHGVSAEVVEDSILYYWDSATVRQLMSRFPQLALNSIDLLAKRHLQLQTRFREMATEKVEKRVIHALLYLAKYVGRQDGDNILIDMSLSRQDLAEMAGTNLYNVSRFLRKWEKAGIVDIGRQWVSISDHKKLTTLAKDN